jgi:hypothetical protein
MTAPVNVFVTKVVVICYHSNQTFNKIYLKRFDLKMMEKRPGKKPGEHCHGFDPKPALPLIL